MFILRGAAAVTALLDGLKVVLGADNLTLYTWGTGTTTHYFCLICGIYTHHQSRSNPNEYGVNLGCLDDVNPRDLGDIEWVDEVNHPSDQSESNGVSDNTATRVFLANKAKLPLTDTPSV